MKKKLSILLLFACLSACKKPKNDTTSIKIDTLVRNEFRTTNNHITEKDRHQKSLTYFVEINKDTSDFACTIENSRDYGLSMDAYYEYRYVKKPKNYTQRLNELTKILMLAQKDFPLDSLQGISMGLLVSLGDVAIEVSTKFEQKTGNILDKDYEKINKLLYESRLTTDLNAIFESFHISVARIRCEKLWLRSKKELIVDNYFDSKTNLPENIIDGMVTVEFKKK